MSEVEAKNVIPKPRFPVSYYQVANETESYVIRNSHFTLGGDDTYFATYWKPKQLEKPKGLVFICHGFAEYFCPSYDRIAETLVQSGYLVFGHDHIGHGRSGGEKALVKSLDEYVIPVLAHVKKVQNDYPELPLSIIGHSMGGLITVNAAMAEPNLFKSIVLMGPLIKLDPNIYTPILKMVSKILGAIKPSIYFGGIDETGITRDEGVVKRVAEDPLCWHGGIKLGLANVLFKALDDLEKDECLKRITAPLLIMQGGQDRIILPMGAPFLHENVGSEHKKLLMYDDAYHNMYCELEDVREIAIKETFNWIEQYS